MKIGIDLRFISDNLYSKFVTEIVELLIKKESNNQYIIYGNGISSNFNEKNITIKNINIKNGSFDEQSKFLKILNSDKNNIVIFFNHFKPIMYKGEYITMVGTLKDIYYMNFRSYFEKYKFLFLMGKNFKKSNKLICLDKQTLEELIEKFDIKESKIELINGFFPGYKNQIQDDDKEIYVSIRAKYGINKDYFIYSGGDSIEKNYDKLISVLSRLNEDGRDISLVFLGHHISSNLNLRGLIIDTNMQNNVHFLGTVPSKDKKYLYKESLGTIFPSFYEPFPFKLSDPLYYNSPIIASDLKSIKSIFSDEISYFSPISVKSIYETTKNFLDKKENEKKIDYKDILSKYNKENTTDRLIEIIKL